MLRDSRLVVSHRVGKEVLFTVVPDELERTASWMTTHAATWSERLELLKQRADQRGARQDRHAETDRL